MGEALKSDRRHEHRCRHLLTKHGGRRPNLADIAKHPRTKAQTRPGGQILGNGELLARASGKEPVRRITESLRRLRLEPCQVHIPTISPGPLRCPAPRREPDACSRRSVSSLEAASPAEREQLGGLGLARGLAALAAAVIETIGSYHAAA